MENDLCVDEDIVEDEYDALNDETFGIEADAPDDTWEENHELLAAQLEETIKREHNAQHIEDIVKTSISHLGIDSDGAASAQNILSNNNVSRNDHHQPGAINNNDVLSMSKNSQNLNGSAGVIMGPGLQQQEPGSNGYLQFMPGAPPYHHEQPQYSATPPERMALSSPTAPYHHLVAPMAGPHQPPPPGFSALTGHQPGFPPTQQSQLSSASLRNHIPISGMDPQAPSIPMTRSPPSVHQLPPGVIPMPRPHLASFGTALTAEQVEQQLLGAASQHNQAASGGSQMYLQGSNALNDILAKVDEQMGRSRGKTAPLQDTSNSITVVNSPAYQRARQVLKDYQASKGVSSTSPVPSNIVANMAAPIAYDCQLRQNEVQQMHQQNQQMNLDSFTRANQRENGFPPSHQRADRVLTTSDYQNRYQMEGGAYHQQKQRYNDHQLGHYQSGPHGGNYHSQRGGQGYQNGQQRYYREERGYQQNYYHQNSNRHLNSKNIETFGFDAVQERQQMLEAKQQAKNPRSDDPYAGLMTQKEKDFVVRVQMISLNMQAPQEQDYYYLEFMKKKSQGKAICRNRLLTQRYDRNSHNRTHQPIQYENSLGKLHTVTAHAPKKILDMSGSRKLEEGEGRTVPANTDLLNFRKLLMDIERAFSDMLKLEDPEVLTSTEDKQTAAEELVKKISWSSVEVMLSVRKGRVLVLRSLAALWRSPSYRQFVLEILRNIFENLDTILFRQKNLSDSVFIERADIIDDILSDCIPGELAPLRQALFCENNIKRALSTDLGEILKHAVEKD